MFVFGLRIAARENVIDFVLMMLKTRNNSDAAFVLSFQGAIPDFYFNVTTSKHADNDNISRTDRFQHLLGHALKRKNKISPVRTRNTFRDIATLCKATYDKSPCDYPSCTVSSACSIHMITQMFENRRTRR